MSSELTVEVSGFVAVFEMHRPPANYFDREILRQIADAAAELERGKDCRAIVLCSEGKHFCAGANFGEGELGVNRAESTRRLYTEAVRVFGIKLPVIAAVQGSAVGGGLGLACAADFRVATPSSRFHANFAKLGFHQGFALSVSLPRIVGQQAALDMLYTGRRLTGAQAHQIGLVDRLVGDGKERETAIAWAREIAASAPLAVRSIKQTMRSGLAGEARAILDHELAEQSRLWQTSDCRIGIAASLARETPHFTGD